MRTILVVEPDPLGQSLPQRGPIGKGVQVEVVVLHRPPQPLDEDIVLHPAATVHADAHCVSFKHLGEGAAGELSALVRVEDLRGAKAPQRFLQRLNTKVAVQRIGKPESEHLSAGPVHDGHQIHEPPGHGDVGDVGGPDLFGSVNRQAPQQVRVNLCRAWGRLVRGLENIACMNLLCPL
jgi:hypothetical protein